MKHYLFFLRANPGSDKALQDWLLHDAGPAIAASDDCAGIAVNIAVDPPSAEPLYQNEGRDGDGYDVTLDLTCPDEAGFGRLAAEWIPQIDARTEANFGYDVEYLVEKDEDAKLRGHPTPGYKIMRGFYFFDDLSPEAARRCWDNHVNAALRLHGFDRYVRYWVNKPVTPDAPAIGGATNLHFHSADAVLNGYFKVPDGMTQIAQDIGHFIRLGLARVFTEEYVLK